MQPNSSKTQARLRRFIRQPEKLQNRRLTDKGLQAIAIIERYRFLPTSLLVRLMPGDQKNNHRHLQTLFHKGLVNRFCLPKYGGPTEFIYYLDSANALSALREAGLLPEMDEEQRWRREDIVRYNRESDYSRLHKDPANQGQVVFIQHELMVSRFHAVLELACRKYPGKVLLEQWKQGPELWNRLDVPKVVQDRDSGMWLEQPETESMPHRPDAFFTLHFPGRPEGEERSHFLYEADRGTENTTKYKFKLRVHWHFIVKRQLQRTTEPYNIHAIRAVLTESTTSQWAHNLREAARHPLVSPKPSPLFWFTTSELLTKPVPAGKRTIPLYLEQPEAVFKRIWANPVENKLFNLAD